MTVVFVNVEKTPKNVVIVKRHKTPIPNEKTLETVVIDVFNPTKVLLRMTPAEEIVLLTERVK